MMTKILPIVLLAVIILALAATWYVFERVGEASKGDDIENPLSTNHIQNAPHSHTPWRYPVVISSNSGTAVLEAAEVLARHLRVGAVQRAQRNPVCCFWIEFAPRAPLPSTTGFVVLIHDDGAEIRVSDLQQLELAIERIKRESVVDEDGVVSLPHGLLTNYTVISD